MDLVPFLNSGLLANIKLEKEIPTEFLDDPETERNCANYLNIDQKPKYGRVLISASGKYTLLCDGCKGRFDSTDSFTRHAKGVYSGCGIWKDSNDGISINKVAFERGDFRSKEDIKEDITVCRITKDFNVKESVTNDRETIVRNETSSKEKNLCFTKCSESTKKPNVIITAKPIYDEKKNFCITCDRQWESRKTFLRHKYYHREKFRKQMMARSNQGRQEDISGEVIVKDELDFGDYEMHDSAYNEGSIKTIDDDGAERLRLYSGDTLDSQSFHGGSSVQGWIKTEPMTNTTNEDGVRNEMISATLGKLGLVTSEEKTSLCEDVSGKYGTDADQGLESGGSASVVFALEPDFDDAKTLCITCNCQFNSKEAFKRHKKIHKSEIVKWKIANGFEVEQGKIKVVFSENPIFDDEKNFCITCNRGFTSIDSFKTHKKLHRRKIRAKGGFIKTEARFSCEFCSEQLRSEIGLRTHIVSQHGDNIPEFLQNDPTYLECRFCFMRFEKPTERFQHEKSHSDEPEPYRCPVCPKSFARNMHRKIHESIHRKDRPFRCVHCPKSFSTRQRLNSHVRCVHCSKKPLMCEDCGKIFDSKVQLRRHSLAHTKEKNYECDECGIRLRHQTSLYRHKKRHANQRDFKCEKCEKLFFTNGELLGHMSVHSEVYFQCPHCEKRFRRKNNMTAHKKVHEKVDEDSESRDLEDENSQECEGEKGKKLKFKCTAKVFSLEPQFDEEKHFCITCNRQMHSIEAFRFHKSSHKFKIHKWKQRNGWEIKKGPIRIVFSENPSFDDERNFCITCNRGFATRATYRCHKRIHRIRIRKRQGLLPKATISCEFCTRQFRSEAGLREHIVPHHGDKIPTSLKDDPTYLMCRFCHEQFEKPTERFQHEKTHANEEKPYRCPLCPKSFTKSSARRIHESFHGETRLFPCLQCPKIFGFLPYLNRHVERVHSNVKSSQLKIKSYPCKKCGNSFNTKRKLASHNVTHIKEKPLECEECGIRFSGLQSLRVHKKRHANRRNYKCEKCGTLFLTDAEFQKHMSKTSDDGAFQCPIFDEQSEGGNSLIVKKEVEDCEETYSCPISEEKFTQHSELQSHFEPYGLGTSRE
ncbi:unnamed protein product [Hermetia illucens]|uniref:C2H2-type domain-containing protein n=3 Tax=Hermetia illucens TaxID=343691 RepID=A0A7R8UGN9_HERIL|nr:unnamed protein product [Hermetia illucens]